MAAKKQVNADKLIGWYMDEVLSDERSETVYAFSKKYNFEEQEFYSYFNSFDGLEKAIFAVFCSKTVSLLMKNDAYVSYDAKGKLLSFYYTFFELLTANRSYVYHSLKENSNMLASLSLLTKLKEEFTTYVKTEVYTEGFDFKNKTANKLRDKGVEEAAWLHLLFTLKFWLEDSSPNFEKTDLFIEKSVKASFDIRDTTPLESVFDFAKFLWKEKVPSS